MVMLLSHEDPDDVVEPMMLTHGMVDGADGDVACLLMMLPLEMMEPLEMVEPCWRCFVDALEP